MSAPSSGDWFVSNEPEGPVVRHCEQGFSVCEFPYGNEGDAANARLIAAAPDLLAALVAMTDRWEPDCAGQDRVMWENARAAIAKATQP